MNANIIYFFIYALFSFGCVTNPNTYKKNFLRDQIDPKKWLFSETRLEILKHDSVMEIETIRTTFSLMKEKFHDHPDAVYFLNQRVEFLNRVIEETIQHYDHLIGKFDGHKNVVKLYYFHDETHFDTGFAILSDNWNILYIEGFTSEGNRIEVDN